MSVQQVPGLSQADLNAALDTLRDTGPSRADKVPPGWKTTKQWAAVLGMSDTSARRRIQRAVEDGAFEIKKFRVPNAEGRVVPIPHFRHMPTAQGCARAK